MYSIYEDFIYAFSGILKNLWIVEFYVISDRSKVLHIKTTHITPWFNTTLHSWNLFETFIWLTYIHNIHNYFIINNYWAFINLNIFIIYFW